MEIALRNHEFAVDQKGYEPYPAYETEVLSILRQEMVIRATCSSKIYLPNNIVVVFESMLRLLDEYTAADKARYDAKMRKETSLLLSHHWAHFELSKAIEENFILNRDMLPPRTRVDRVCNRAAQVLMCFPTYERSRHIFETMRLFRYSYFVCEGFGFLFSKHHRLMGIDVHLFQLGAIRSQSFTHSLRRIRASGIISRATRE